MRAPALKPGDTIGVMATSCWLPQEDLDAAKSFIEQRGYNVFIHPQATARHHQSAGTAAEKAAAWHDLITNPDIKMIIGARGGNRALTMLDKIDLSLPKTNPKIIMSYSDVTTILNAIYKHTNLTTFHGPLFRELPTRGDDLDQMLSLLSGTLAPIPLNGAKILKEGSAEGLLMGGNLSLLQTLMGTPHQPDFTGAILFLEDVGDHLSRYDRMLAHLRLTGALNQINALILGEFIRVQDDKDRPFGFSLEEIVLEHTDGLDIPILMNAPFGHGDRLPTFPIGCKARLEGTTLTLLESPVV